MLIADKRVSGAVSKAKCREKCRKSKGQQDKEIKKKSQKDLKLSKSFWWQST